MSDHKEPVYRIPVRSLLRETYNPMTRRIWGNDPFTAREVKRFIKEKRFETKQWCSPGSKNNSNIQQEPVDTDWHIARVAHLAVNKQEHPIVLMVSWWHVEICDGHHRLAAAITRKDKYINVSYDGIVDEFFRRFRSAEEITNG